MPATIDTQTVVDSLKAAINLIETHFGGEKNIKVPDNFVADTVLPFDEQLQHIRANNDELAGLVSELKGIARERGLA